MFRDVPECSRVFHVPGVIDGPYGPTLSRKTTCLFFSCNKLVLQPITNGFVYATLNRVVRRLLTTFIIKFPYNSRSDWLKQRTLSENKEQTNDIKLAFKFLNSEFRQI